MDIDSDYERLLRGGYTDGPDSPSLSLLDLETPWYDRWLSEEATPWWEGITALAQRDGLQVMCYPGISREYESTQSPCARLLHPHTSLEWEGSGDFDRRLFREGEQLLEVWRRVAAVPWPGDLPDVADDYELLVKHGRVRDSRTTYITPEFGETAPAEQHRGYDRWLAEVIPWCAAVTRLARQDGRPIYCSRFTPNASADLLDPRTSMTRREAVPPRLA